MKPLRSWSEDEKRKFVEDYVAVRGDQRAVGELCRRRGVPPKNAARTAATWIAALGISFPKQSKKQKEQTALSLPNVAEAETPKQKVYTTELKNRLLEKYFGGLMTELQKKAFLEQHGLTTTDIHSWRVGTRWGTNSSGPMVGPDTIAKRQRTRGLSEEQKAEMGRTYMSLGRGARTQYAKDVGIAFSTLNKWGQQAARGDARPPIGRPPGSRNGVRRHQRETEEVDLSQAQPEPEPALERKKLSYADLVKQNLLLKGLLDLAKADGWDIDRILRFGK
jgi:transposase-like protein